MAGNKKISQLTPGNPALTGDLLPVDRSGSNVSVTVQSVRDLTPTSPTPIANGGTGQATKVAGFDALSPLTAAGDILYGGISGTGTALPKGTSGQVLIQGATNPNWGTTFTGAGWPTLPNFSTSQIFVSNAGTGDIDLFTVPAGKRAMFEAFIWNSTASSIAAYPEVKIGGTYYAVQTKVTLANTTTVAINPVWPIILEAGQKFSINTTGTGLNIVGCVYLFDNTSGLKTSLITSFINGNNTVYTCPALKTSFIITRVGGGLVNNAATGGNIYVCNNTAGTLNYSWNFVPSGGSVGLGNQITPATSTAATAGTPIAANLAMGINFTAGDFLSVNSTSTNAAQLSWVNIVEM